MPRSQEWLDSFACEIDQIEDEEIKSLVLDGSIEICPCCGELSAYSWDDASETLDDSPFAKNPGKVAHIPTASGFEWQCGHCLANLADADSPILAPCYTHSED